ncbi:MAG: UPF0175 family protein [Bacteroidales bacterium]|nr:UPF0175 family protein [Bacteroidales bacterium]
MKKNNLTFPEIELEATVNAGIFKNKSVALREAISTFFIVKPSMRLEAAIELYKEKKVTLGKAAEIAGIDLWSFKDLIGDRGIKVETECGSKKMLDSQFA